MAIAIGVEIRKAAATQYVYKVEGVKAPLERPSVDIVVVVVGLSLFNNPIRTQMMIFGGGKLK